MSDSAARARLTAAPAESTEAERDLWSSTTVVELFETRAHETPHACALTFLADELSYSELNAQANELAHALRDLGVSRETLVAVCCEPGFEPIVAILGVLKAGGAYLPLDSTYPRERVRSVLADSGSKLVLSQQATLSQLPDGPWRVLCLDHDRQHVEREPSDDLERQASPDNLAYVIYTSGSTGHPKGVAIEHRNLANLVRAQLAAFEISAASRVLQFASPSFDASVSEIFTALVAGATLVLLDRDERIGSPLVRALRDRRVTVATLPPSLLTSLDAPPRLPDLRTLVVAGEQCPAELVPLWGKGRRFLNAYGPTEATVCATVALCEDDASRPPIGRAIPGVEVQLLDSRLEPVGEGETGEIHVAGAGVARGYLGRPALTAERFRPNPGDPPGSRLYRTGDLARRRPDGQLEFLGRTDEQVKVRGFRVEPGEIETRLDEHPHVRQAVVGVHEHPSGDKRLVAYVVAERGQAPPSAELGRFLAEAVPDYMIPSAFVALESLPLTPSGKVDRRALTASSRPSSEVGAREAASQASELERTIAAIWRDILELEEIGLDDNFFDLGGHSLLATQVTARVGDALRIDVGPDVLFEAPTVSEFAAAIEDLLMAEIDQLSDEEAVRLVDR